MWRGHRRRYEPLDHAGSRVYSGRFHLAAVDAPDGVGWPALYLALELAVAVGEVQRNLSRGDWDSVRLTEIDVVLSEVVDLRGLPIARLIEFGLFADWDYTVGHALAGAVREDGAEGMLVPSATRLGDNLIVFPDRLRPTSTLAVVRTVDPDLTKEPR